MTLSEELYILVKINEYRQKNNLLPLKLDGFCSDLARIHSQNMADKVTPFSHDQFNDRINLIKNQYKELHFGSASENVYYASPNLGEPVPSWQKSVAHNRNMLGNFTCCGIGYANKDKKNHYVTAIFVKFN